MLLAAFPQARAQGTIAFVAPAQPIYYAAGVELTHDLDLNNDGLTDLILVSDAMRAYLAPQTGSSVIVAADGFVVPLNRGDVVSADASSLDPTYAWFDSAIHPTGFATLGAQPDVTSWYTAKGPGSYLAQLKVTDNTALSFPSSGKGNLTSPSSSALVYVRAASDPACGCITDLAARAKSGKIQLTWKAQPAAASYNVYRGTITGGPYLKIGSTASTYATFLDSTAVNGTTYYYVVRTAAANTNELCQSNQAVAKAMAR